MAVMSDIREIQSALKAAEDAPTRGAVRRLHNLLAEKMVEHRVRLGLTDNDIIALGGGTPKPDED
jgi:hypothetical protein